MPSKIVHARKPIHEHVTSQQEDSDQEDELPTDDEQDSFNSKYESDMEKYEEEIYYTRSCNEQNNFRISRSASRTPNRHKSTAVEASPVRKCIKPTRRHSFMHFFSITIIIIAMCYCFFIKEAEPKICSFELLKKEYPKENNQLWNYLKVGIESILNDRTQKPAVYLFSHYGTQQAFQLIKAIAAHSSDCFGKKLIPMESEDFIAAPGTLDDYGYAIEKYRKKIKDGNVILIANLNQIPAEAARALHTICDTHSPILKNAVIFLTLTIQKNKEGIADAVAEETLIELWGAKLKRNELDPLITRVTDQVIVLKS